jgi:tight adherence protein C
MPLAISAFLIVSALVYGLGLLLVCGSRNREAEVLAGGRLRPLVFGPSTKALAGLIPLAARTKAAITKELRQAGYYHRWAFEEFASLRNALVAGWVIFLGTLLVLFTQPGDAASLKLAAAGLTGAVLLYGLPRLVLSSRAKARAERIQYALPDALDMITMCVAGGVPLEQAFHRVGSELGETHPDLACELRILARQTQAGSLDHALKQFASRLDTPDAHSLAALVGQTDRQGNSVARAFQEFADHVRRERRQRAEEAGNKTTVKMLFPLVFCLAPPIYMLLLAPAVIELRSFVLRENRPGGLLNPSQEVLWSASATPNRRQEDAGPVETAARSAGGNQSGTPAAGRSGPR